MKSIAVSLCVFLSIILFSCGGGGEEYEHTFTDIDIEFEEPLFEGPNSANVQISNALFAYCAENKLDANSISDVRLINTILTMQGNNNFDNFQNILIQFVSKESGFTEAAGLSPIEKSQNQINIPIAEKAKLTDIFKSESFTMVIDGNLFEDSDESYFLKANFTVSFKAKTL